MYIQVCVILTVQHNLKDLQEGSTILTLADSKIRRGNHDEDEGGDVLMNVDLVDTGKCIYFMQVYVICMQ